MRGAHQPLVVAAQARTPREQGKQGVSEGRGKRLPGTPTPLPRSRRLLSTSGAHGLGNVDCEEEEEEGGRGARGRSRGRAEEGRAGVPAEGRAAEPAGRRPVERRGGQQERHTRTGRTEPQGSASAALAAVRGLRLGRGRGRAGRPAAARKGERR